MSSQLGKPRPYWGGYILGLIMLVMEALRIRQNFAGTPFLGAAFVGLGSFALAFGLEFLLSSRTRWPWTLYFVLQLGCILFLAALPPFLDVLSSLYLPLFVQAYYHLPRRQASRWALAFAILLTAMMVLGLGLWDGLALGLQMVAEAVILTTLAVLVVQSSKDRAESQALVTDLQEARRRLQEYTAQAGQLVAERERNRLARELHDSVGQMIFSIELTCESARMQLERDPAQVPALLARMQEMSAASLRRLRSIISDLRPHP